MVNVRCVALIGCLLTLAVNANAAGDKAANSPKAATTSTWVDTTSNARTFDLSPRRDDNSPISSAFASDVSDKKVPSFNIVSDDVERFGRMISHWQKGNVEANTKLIKAQYLKSASYGLSEFFRIKIRDEQKFVSAVDSLLPHYSALEAYAFDAESLRPALTNMFANFSAWTDDAQPMDVYFVVGRFSSAGTVTKDGVLIGVEHYAQAPAPELVSKGYKFQSFSALTRSVAHEYVHSLQRQAGPRTLIRGAIFEGGADFLASLATGISPVNQENYQYGLANEAAVWQRFERDMFTSNASLWLANQKTDTWPADMGYFVGYQIAKNFYENMDDKREAFRHLTYVTDPEFILTTSQYGRQF